MDGARVLLADMETQEARLDRLRERDATRRWGFTAALLIAGTLVFVDRRDPAGGAARVAEIRRRAQPKKNSACCRRVFAGIDDGITLQDRTRQADLRQRRPPPA